MLQDLPALAAAAVSAVLGTEDANPRLAEASEAFLRKPQGTSPRILSAMKVKEQRVEEVTQVMQPSTRAHSEARVPLQSAP